MSGVIDILISIGKANLIAILLLIASFIVETITGLKLFIDSFFRWRKSNRNANDCSYRDTGTYLLIMIIVFIYDVINDNILNATFNQNYVSFIVWLVIISILVQVFYRLHKKYQAVDPNKADDDYT